MDISILILLFLFGIIIGSFLNVVSLRYKPGANFLDIHILSGRSHCSDCQTTLRWYELVPLFSFFIQKMKCRHCTSSLSWQYPLVEFITGLLTVAIPTFFRTFFQFSVLSSQGQGSLWFYGFVGVWLLITYIFIVISIIDLRHRVIPDQANILLAIFGFGLILIKDSFPSAFPFQGSFFKSYSVIFTANASLLLNITFAVLTALVVYGGIILLTRGRGMGMGDLKLALPIALILSWPDVILAFSASFIIGASLAVPLLLHKVKKMSDAIPFGPFLILGVYVAVFYGYTISSWYFSLI